MHEDGDHDALSRTVVVVAVVAIVAVVIVGAKFRLDVVGRILLKRVIL